MNDGELLDCIFNCFVNVNCEKLALVVYESFDPEEFCYKHLFPEVEKNDYFPIYVNLKSSNKGIEYSFCQGVFSALERKSHLKLEKMLDRGIENRDCWLEYARDLLSRLLLILTSSPVLIVLNASDYLTDEKGLNFTHMLRSFLVNKSMMYKHPMHTLFISEKKAKLLKVFNDEKAPFFGAINIIENYS